MTNPFSPTVAYPSDVDPDETREWLESLESVLEREGPERVHFLIQQLVTRARERGGDLPFKATTAYVNSIPTDQEPLYPGDPELEWRIRRLNRWNAVAMILRANADGSGLGGHISTFASSATLYDVGLNHFWRGRTENHPGDMVYFQGHSAPGIYARAFLEGRLTEEDLVGFRQELSPNGLSSYPHPWLMPNFWQFPTVSMGLGPIMAIYQARFQKYMEHRGLVEPSDRKVWAFLGDGETDEPESLGAIGLAAREGLDNLIFVINCNLQRLDGPVRGNGKIIQELEGTFRGAGWDVIKVIWGSNWDPLLARDKDGMLHRLMNEFLDGDYQSCKAKGGGFTREHFFGRYEETKRMVASMTDRDVGRLRRGGHDHQKVYAAYAAAMNRKGRPTVILAKTVKGYGMGSAGEGQNITHQQKKMSNEALKAFRDRYKIPVTDEQLEVEVPFVNLEEGSIEKTYLLERRKALGGFVPERTAEAEPLEIPKLGAFGPLLESTGDRKISSTMALVRIMNTLCRDKQLGDRIVPIVPDESRTFGMEGMFRQLGIYNPLGQLYHPEDKEQLMFYKEDRRGQVLQEGINEAGGMSDWIAAGTAYSTHGVAMIPFFIFYSMFGFQRVGDLAWAAGDSRARGFLIGGTAGRTTLNGEGLQHQDGHSHVLAGTVPNCISYDPTFAYEMAVIVHHGLERMFVDRDDVYFYITAMNENYIHPAMPPGAEEGIKKGLYLLSDSRSRAKKRVQLIGSGTILLEVMAAAELLSENHGVKADVWSATSFNELAREGHDVERTNRLHPEQPPAKSFVERSLEGRPGPVIASTDYVRAYAEQIRAFVPNRYTVLGTDGFGRSDRREGLRRHFEVDRHHVVVAALKALADEGTIQPAEVAKAIERYDIDADAKPPRLA